MSDPRSQSPLERRLVAHWIRLLGWDTSWSVDWAYAEARSELWDVIAGRLDPLGWKVATILDHNKNMTLVRVFLVDETSEIYIQWRLSEP